MNATYAKLAVILLAGLMFRLALLALIDNPGLHDPVHYYNLGQRLADGQGFTIDYVWHYSHLPADVVHPIDHWMPLAGVAAGLGASLAGDNIHAALGLFILAGTLLPVLVFCYAKQLHESDGDAMIAAALAAVLPDLLVSSLRTDTTILNALFITLSALLLNRGLLSGDKRSLLISGVAAGLAYLTRNDSLLMLLVAGLTLVIHCRHSGRGLVRRRTGMMCLAFVAGFGLVAAPWMLRNLHETGILGSAETGRMFFMVEHVDHYAFGLPITLESMLRRQTLAELLTKRAFEWLAALKQIAASLGFPLIALVPVGLGGVIRAGESRRMIMLAPPLLWLAGILIAYPILLPLKSQAGSFEKAFLTVLPMFLPLGALGFTRVFKAPIMKRGAVALTVIWLGWNSYDFLRQEAVNSNRYYDSIRVVLDALEDLPDITGDDRIRLMAQDPYVFSYFGYESIMVPFASREDTIALARRYSIDYLMMPPGRPALDGLYLGQEIDERFERVAHLPEAGPKPYELYRFHFD